MPNGRELIELHFPGLRGVEWFIRSDRDTKYNCVAFALGDTAHWWQPPPWDAVTKAAWFWPKEGPSSGKIDDYVWLFEQKGWALCDSPVLEAGFEKLALYSTADGERIHVARMDESGRWFSKLGKSHDIEHPNHDCVVSETWTGPAVMYMRREVPKPPELVAVRTARPT